MALFLANENVPTEAVEAARHAAFDVASVRELSPGIDDETVLSLARSQGRVVVTFDKDFGEMAFQRGQSTAWGVILLRPRLRSPEFVAQFFVTVLSQPINWEGHFCVAREGMIRVVPMPP